MSRADELRAEAAKLEEAERVAAIEARCMSHGIEWNSHGRAFEKFGEFIDCDDHDESYTDEYGSWQHCRNCQGNGRNFVMHHVRRPQYDAPRPA